MNSSAFSVKNINELSDYLDQFREKFTPTLAIVFISPDQKIEEVASVFNQHNIDIFGATSAGELFADGKDAFLVMDSISGLLLDIHKDDYRIKLLEAHDNNYSKPSCEIAKWADQLYKLPAFIVASGGLTANGDDIVNGLKTGNSKEPPIFGGFAGAHDMNGTTVFTNKSSTGQGIVALVLNNENIEITGIASSGWMEIGAEKVVTSSTGNVVHTLDNKQALEIYREYISENYAREGKDTLMATEYPLQLQREDGSSVLRAAMVVDKESGSIIYAGAVPQGSHVKFSAPPGLEIIDHTVNEIKDFHKKNPRSNALLLFSCRGRHDAVGPMLINEVRPMQELWNVPLAGFLTFGEIGPKIEYGCDFHNNTCVLVSISSKN
ncbi:MAG: FIST C-terminal domain-containing protein [Spirochaetia bacterium]|nr:FIST C-terminal domain-containing protein [Spirochaetia bacterium]